MTRTSPPPDDSPYPKAAGVKKCFLAVQLTAMAMDASWLDRFLWARRTYDIVMAPPDAGASAEGCAQWLDSTGNASPSVAPEASDASSSADDHALFTDAPSSLQPEIALDAFTIHKLGLAWAKGQAQRLADEGFGCSIHLPFKDIHPASLDDDVLEGARASLARALEFAAVFSPDHLVAHADWTPNHAGEMREEFLERSAETWRFLVRQWPGHPPLYLENTFESTPEPLRDLMTVLHEEDISLCFDVGHLNCFADGVGIRDLRRWLQQLGPYIHHIHLHDNNGSADQHLGLGRGVTPWELVMQLLNEYADPVSMALEPRTDEGLRESLTFMGSRQDVFAAFVPDTRPIRCRRSGEALLHEFRS